MDDTTSYYIFAKGHTDEAQVSYSLIYDGPTSDSVFIPAGGKRIDLDGPGEYRLRANKASFTPVPLEMTVALTEDEPGDTVDFLFSTETTGISIFINGLQGGAGHSFDCRITRDDPPFEDNFDIPSAGYLYTSTEYGTYTITPITEIEVSPESATLVMDATNPDDTATFVFSDPEYVLAVSGDETGFTLYHSTDTLAGWTEVYVSGDHYRLIYEEPTIVFVRAEKMMFTAAPSVFRASLTAAYPTDSVHFHFEPIPSIESEIYMADLSGGRVIFSEDMFGTGFSYFDGEGFFPATNISDVHVTDDYIYALDYSRGGIIRMSDMSGSDYTYFEGEGSMALYHPARIITDAFERIYIADKGNHRIVRMDDMTGAGFLELSSLDGGGRLFSFPQGLALDPYGRIYIVDSGNSRIMRIDDMLGSNLRVWDADGDMEYPTDIALDESFRIYISDPTANAIWRADDIFGTNSEMMHTGVESPLSIDIIGNTVYWGGEMGIYRAEWRSASVYWQPTPPCQGVTGIQVFE